MFKALSPPKILILPNQHPNTVNYEFFNFFQAFYQKTLIKNIVSLLTGIFVGAFDLFFQLM